MQQQAQMERWGKVIGWPYEVSDIGRVRSIATKSVLAIQKAKRGGYMQVMLYLKGRRKNASVHRLVAEVFVKRNDVRRNTVNHLNFDRTDNRYSNLEWVTERENHEYTAKSGRSARLRGELSGMAKYTKEKVLEVLKLKEDGHGPVYISKKLKIPYSTVEHIMLGSRWRHLQETR